MHTAASISQRTPLEHLHIGRLRIELCPAKTSRLYRLQNRVLCGALLLATLFLATRTTAGEPAVAMGEVSVAETSARADELRVRFTTAVEQRLSRFAFEKSATRRPLLLSARLSELSTESTEENTKTRCRVSAVLRLRNDGTVIALARGRASAEQSRARTSATEAVAMRAAVDGALGRLEATLP